MYPMSRWQKFSCIIRRRCPWFEMMVHDIGLVGFAFPYVLAVQASIAANTWVISGVSQTKSKCGVFLRALLGFLASRWTMRSACLLMP